MLIWINGQAFADYRTWECYRAGFWNEECVGSQHVIDQIQRSVALLRSAEAFRQACKRVIREWPISAAVHLSNPASSGRSFLGQTSCFLEHGARKCCTVSAWWTLDRGEQSIANEVAEQEISKWVTDNANCQKLSIQLEFQFMKQLANE